MSSMRLVATTAFKFWVKTDVMAIWQVPDCDYYLLLLRRQDRSEFIVCFARPNEPEWFSGRYLKTYAEASSVYAEKILEHVSTKTAQFLEELCTK